MFCYKCGSNILSHHKFCSSCGEKIDFSFLNKDVYNLAEVKLSRKPINYKDIFYKLEMTLKKESSLSEDEFEEHWGKFKNYHYKNDNDNDIFWRLIQVIFFSGFKAATVTAKLPEIKKYFYDYNIVKHYSEEQIERIIDDKGNEIICNMRKMLACVENAKIFNGIVLQYGSFANYLESFGDLSEEVTLDTLREDLRKFSYLGKITSYHFMLDLGLNVWKPDRVILRILKRLSLIDDTENTEKNIRQAIKVGREISSQVGLPIRYIDLLFVKYGQQGNEKPFGLENGGICLEKNPRCSICGIKEYCTHQV